MAYIFFNVVGSPVYVLIVPEHSDAMEAEAFRWLDNPGIRELGAVRFEYTPYWDCTDTPEELNQADQAHYPSGSGWG
jgi:hypothetical protein